ncbi:TolC family protein [Dokdonella sp.]|uniref:TolC family protein n=1 Tax=Dokdonella sp. TaxID=2291710 RepID=UPI001B04BEC4|nr:TolC family protein [Dokdonella sp.]MBO9661546.1 TolC family protein [Dokdonella sp.]
MISLATPTAFAEQAAAGLTLSQALQRMRTHDPNLAVAQTAVDQAAADEISAGERPNATLSYGTSKINPAGHNGPGSLWDKSFDTIVSIQQPFERGGKRRHRLAAAAANRDASEADYDDVVRRERLVVTQAYWELKRAQQKSESAHALAALARGSLDAAQARLRHGDIAALDVERLRIGAAEADNAAGQADAAREDARVALAALLDAGQDADALEAVDDWPGPGFVAPEADAANGRADVQAAERRIAAAQAALDLAHAQRKRDISVSANYEHNPAPFGHTLLGFGVSVPLFTGNHYDGEIARANADIDAARAQLARAQVAARADLGRALADVRSANERLRRYDGDLVDRARRVERTAETAYARGGLALIELLDARRELKAVEDDATDARADFAEALAALAAASASMEKPSA